MGDNLIPLKAVIWDLDDTFWSSEECNKYLPADMLSREGWDNFNKYIHLVKPYPWAVNMVNLYRNAGYAVVFLTSREDIGNCRWITLSSIFDALDGNIDNITLHMRDAEDYRTSAEVKEEKYLKEIKPYYNIEFAIDDSDSNCMIYKKYNIPVLKKIIER